MRPALFLAALLALSACAPGEARVSDPISPTAPTSADRENAYLGVQTALLDSDLVNFKLAMRGSEREEDLLDYANCAAAQYSQIRDFGYARLVRISYASASGISSADAVYTISQDEPRGINLIDASLILQMCDFEGIPTV